MQRSIDILTRLLSKAELRGNGCWEWVGHKYPDGYGQIVWDGKPWRTHRVSYTLFKGEITNEVVMHKCDNKLCLNPMHLEQGTISQNVRDAFARGLIIPVGCLGERCWRAKLTNEKVLDIRRRVDLGESVTSLAKEFGVRRSTIYKIKQRRRWAHI